MRDLPERWWFRADMNDTQKAVFGKAEPRQLVRERVGAFKRWLDSRPEKVIVVVGHSTYLKDLTGMNKRLRNGELHTQHI